MEIQMKRYEGKKRIAEQVNNKRKEKGREQRD
jgi:hypothetical protein